MAHEGGQKISPQKTSEIDTNYDCRQGNKWVENFRVELPPTAVMRLIYPCLSI